MKKIDWLIIFIITVTSIFLLKDLFLPNFYTSHDGIHQVVRLYNFDQIIRQGQIPPRWAGNLLNGFGYPLFNFSFQLPWFIAEIPYFLGLSIFASIKLTFLLGFIFSGITMYLFQRELFGRRGAFAGTAIYLLAPYRFSNIFVRAAIGDATAFVFAPLLFLAIFKLRKTDKIDWYWVSLGAISLAALLLSHAMVALFFFVGFWLYVIFWLILSQKTKLIFSGMAISILGLGLAGYYFIPSLIERNLTRFSEIMGGVFNGTTYLTLDKLIYSPWGYGTVDAREGAMSLQLGLAQWLVVALAAGTIIFLFWRRKNFPEAIFYFLLFLLSVFVILPFSSWFWNLINRFTFVDFTWRALAVSVFAVSVLAGFVISKFKYPRLLLIFLIIFAVYANRNHLRINQTLDWPVSFYLKLEKTTNTFNEYTPKWVRQDLIEKPKPKVEFPDSQAKIAISKNISNDLEFSLETPREGTVRINTIYYPGWQVSVNDKRVKIDYENTGLIEFPVKSGTNKIAAGFKETPMRLASDIISLVSLGLVGYFMLVRKQVKKI